MRSVKNGKNISVSVENITPNGIWLYVRGKEYFLSYDEFPCFEGQTVKDIHKVKLLHGKHLYWPAIDADLDLDNLEHPKKYPLKTCKQKNKK